MMKDTKKHDYTRYFEQMQGPGGDFIALRGDAPQELKGLMWAIHEEFGCAIPNSWLYSTAYHAFDALEDDVLDDVCIEADAYTSDLVEWLQEPYALESCQQVIEAELCDPKRGMGHIMACAQEEAVRQIYTLVNDFLENHKEEGEEQ